MKLNLQALLWTIAIVSAIIIMAIVMMGKARAVECQTSPGSKNYWSWRYIEPHEHRKCWYEGERVLSKSKLHWPKEKEKEKPAAEKPKPKPIKTDEMLPPRASKPDPSKPEEPNEIDLMADKTPMQDIIEDRPFGPWEERVMGAFRADRPTFRASKERQ